VSKRFLGQCGSEIKEEKTSAKKQTLAHISFGRKSQKISLMNQGYKYIHEKASSNCRGFSRLL
jgi:hypothetical protein